MYGNVGMLVSNTSLNRPLIYFTQRYRSFRLSRVCEEFCACVRMPIHNAAGKMSWTFRKSSARFLLDRGVEAANMPSDYSCVWYSCWIRLALIVIKRLVEHDRWTRWQVKSKYTTGTSMIVSVVVGLCTTWVKSNHNGDQDQIGGLSYSWGSSAVSSLVQWTRSYSARKDWCQSNTISWLLSLA